jgi:hypothetical protein
MKGKSLVAANHFVGTVRPQACTCGHAWTGSAIGCRATSVAIVDDSHHGVDRPFLAGCCLGFSA